MVHGGDFSHGSLNTLLTPGAYGIRSGDDGNTITDYPSELANVNGVMLVFTCPQSSTDAYTIQLLMSHTEIVYIRVKVTYWGVWKKIQLI